jgi:hypothetical protein
MAWTFKQEQKTARSGSSFASTSLTLTAGDLVVVFIDASYGGSNLTTSGVTDTLGNVYTFIRHEINALQFGGGYCLDSFYCQNCIGGTTTITAALPASAGFGAITVLEYGGISLSGALDASASAVANSGTPTCNITTVNADDLVVGIIIASSGSPPCTSSTLTDRSGNFDAGFGPIGDYEVTPAATVAISATGNSSGIWIESLAAFKIGGAAGPNSFMLRGTGV